MQELNTPENEDFKYNLFKQYYHPSKSKLPPILNKGSLTSFHIREGNKLIQKATELLKQGTFSEAANLIKIAMCTYGSAQAIKLYEMMGKLGCHFTKVPDLDLTKQIIAYEKAQEIAIKKELNDNFESDNIPNCLTDITIVQRRENWKMTWFINDFKDFYQAQQNNADAKFVDTSRKQMPRGSSHAENIADKLFERPKYPVLDAKGYLGIKPPSGEKAWYLDINKKEEENFNKIKSYFTP